MTKPGASPSDGGSARMDLSPKKPAEFRREKRIWFAAPESSRASNSVDIPAKFNRIRESSGHTRRPQTADLLLSGSRKGWIEIAGVFALPISAAQRWASMSITREGRRVEALVEELNRMGRETSEPVPIATGSADLSAELRRGLSYGKKPKQARNQARYQARNQENVA